MDLNLRFWALVEVSSYSEPVADPRVQAITGQKYERKAKKKTKKNRLAMMLTVMRYADLVDNTTDQKALVKTVIRVDSLTKTQKRDQKDVVVQDKPQLRCHFFPIEKTKCLSTIEIEL